MGCLGGGLMCFMGVSRSLFFFGKCLLAFTLVIGGVKMWFLLWFGLLIW